MRGKIKRTALWVLLLVLLFNLFPIYVFAATSSVEYPDIDVVIPLDANTVKMSDGAVYSRHDKRMLEPLSIASLGIDTSKIVSASITSDNANVQANCSTTVCTFSEISGEIIAVSANNPISGYFDWWRNQGGGYHGNWWSFDLDDGACLNGGVTCYSQAGQEMQYYVGGNHTVAVSLRDFPGDMDYPINSKKISGAGLQYEDIDELISLSYDYVNLTSAEVKGSEYVIGTSYDDSYRVLDSTGAITFNAIIGPFNGSDSYDGKTSYQIITADPRGLKFPYTFNATFYGETYKYQPMKYKLTLQISDGGSDPDLIPIASSIAGCIEVGTSVVIAYGAQNAGGATTSPFKISLQVDGVEVNYDEINGLGGTPVYKSFNYTFPSAGTRSVTVQIVAPGVAGENSANNTASKSFTVESSCGSSGGGSGVDLVPTSLAIAACYAIGDTAAIQYKYKNTGAAATSTTFRVSLKHEGVEVDYVTVNGLGAGVERSRSFNYTFTNGLMQAFSVVVDSIEQVAETDETNNTMNEYFTPQTTPCSGNPPVNEIKGDFKFENGPVIPWGTAQIVTPVGIEVTGTCNYTAHKFKFSQLPDAGFTTSNLSPETMDKWLLYDPGTRSYDGGISSGTVTVVMTVLTDCGTYAEVTKTFEITPDPNNRPPALQISWFSAAANTASESAIVGDYVFLKATQVSDPDGDQVTVTWDFSSSRWTQGLPAKYGWTSPYQKLQYTGIKADTAGSFKVCAIATDTFKAKSPIACTTLSVQGPEPIPIINGGTIVREGRTLAPALDANLSFSPVQGRWIDHSRDEWRWHASYDNGSTADGTGMPAFTIPGTIDVFLHVFDNTGLKSLEPDSHTVKVIPDQPPIPDFDYTNTMTRGNRTFQNISYSPDGDPIKEWKVSWGYDASNNGMCNPNENAISSSGQPFVFSPPYVGNYCFRVFVKEDTPLQKSAYKDYSVQVINDNPDVTFTVTGTATEPMPMNVTPYKPSDLVNWTNTSLDQYGIPNLWRVTAEGTLLSAARPLRMVSDASGQSGNRMPSQYSAQGPDQGPAIKSSALPLILPSGFYSNPDHKRSFTPLGNDRFIATMSGYSGTFFSYQWLVSPYNAAIVLAKDNDYGGQDYKTYFHRGLGEVVLESNYCVIRSNGDQDCYGMWKRYKINDLKNDHTASGSNTYSSKTNVWTGTVFSGVRPVFSDGTSILDTGNILRFTEDYKMINLADRTIKSYRLDGSGLYKSETYDSIPAFSGACKTYLDHINAKSAMNGDYYTACGTSIYRFDSLTGKPSFVGTFDVPDWDSSPWNYVSSDTTAYSITPDDRRFIGYNRTITYYDYDYNLYTEKITRYFDLMTNSNIYYTPSMTTANPPDGGQSGWGTVSIPYTVSEYHPYDSDGNGCDCYEDVTNYHTGYGDIKANVITDSASYYYGLPSYLYDGNRTLKRGKKNPLDYYESIADYVDTVEPDTSQTPYTNEYFTFGQLINPSSTSFANGTITWNAQYHALNESGMAAGLSFRIRDYKNMYRVEAMKGAVRLTKIVNGRKTTVKEANRSMTNGRWVPYKVMLSETHIKIYEDGSLIIDEYDSTFAAGTIGPYSTADNTEFKGITVQWAEPGMDGETPNTAIVDTDVKYTVDYSDPESDPRLDGRTQWGYQHVDPWMMLDAGDGKSGLSSYNGSVVTSPILSFDRVGRYKLDYRVPDDPHPLHRIAYGDWLFDAYSKYSDFYTQYVIVHRAPLSPFTLWSDGSGVVQWNDLSYDPDRCYSRGNCQPAYAANNGIFAKKYYYITPSGTRVDGKLTHPAEAGSYIVFMAVRDEYGAWSDWYEQNVEVTNTPAPNKPPSVELTFPTGAYEAPSAVTLQPTITWNQADPDPGTMFTNFNLEIKDQWGNCYECVYNRVMDTYGGSWAWTMDRLLQMGGIYQVRVQVSDGESWSAWSATGWMITNRAPEAYMSYPNGTYDNPTVIATTRPTFAWTQSDPDPGTVFTYFRLQVWDESGSILLVDSGDAWEGTSSSNGFWPSGADVPAGQELRVRVKVTDGYLWSAWSPDVWMIVNRPPSVSVTWPSGTFEAPTITNSVEPLLSWTQSDPDPGAIYTKYQVQITDRNGIVRIDSGVLGQWASGSDGSWTVSPSLARGQLYSVRVRVWDQFDAASGWSDPKWLYVNDYPVAAFIWTPDPAYEGDTVTLINQSAEPDNQTYTTSWEIGGPGGYYAAAATFHAAIPGSVTDNRPGGYTVTLTVTDPYGLSSQVTHVIPVGDLVLNAFVEHTEQWELNRKQYNVRTTGSESLPRTADTFWAGEAFMLRAVTTNPADSSTKASAVSAVMQPGGHSAALDSALKLEWKGRIWDESFERLPDGSYAFTFEAVWANGHRETAVVTVRIKDAWTGFTDLHRTDRGIPR